MFTKPLSRFVIAKPLARGRIGFYFTIPTYYRKQGCTIPNEPLGPDYGTACGNDGDGGHAAALNGLFDEWRAILAGESIESIARYGTVDWLFRQYKSSKAYLEKVSARSRPDYERTMLLLADTHTKKAIGSATEASRPFRPSVPTRFMSWLSMVPKDCGSGRVRRWSSFAGELGMWCGAYTRKHSTRMCPTLGQA